MADDRRTIAEINTLDQAAFVAAYGWVFEGSSWIAAAAWSARPFADRAALLAALLAVVQDSPADRQLALIRAHPDLVGRAAREGTLAPASAREQASAGLDRLSDAERETFATLNQTYHERFGFPFVICVREHRQDQILAGFAARLGHDAHQERAVALAEIAKIARLRLADAVREESASDDARRRPTTNGGERGREPA